jgi:hypothetical protein
MSHKIITKPRRGQKKEQFSRQSQKHKIRETKVQTLERKTRKEVSRATEMENSVTYVLKCTKKGLSAST